ncbi:HlyD family type I secretion periplasmic adaptor subunit [Roseicella aquatilis]|uniref:Membrane fusion protein (MFP) family protein n=1 Tax=Roseicella aquatilis TaxID=2527868 RepID=A0A4R4D3E7_9PROT|nr:HlyD family type I secretion periplasmic adaptor subunit [Roseicella aquatilis]TCZ54219.1 HlyD family type I secretion periplasmic adaptor subunit [Roseicella aquatilis]
MNEAAEQALLEFESPTAALVALPAGGIARRVAWVLGAGVLLATAALGLIRVDRVVAATGTTVSAAGTLVVQPLETTILRSIEVRDGQRVRAGEVLARLDPTFAAARLASEAAQATELEAEVARLTAEVEGRRFAAPAGAEATLARQAVLAGERAAQREATLRRFEAEEAALLRQAESAESDIGRITQRLGIAREVEGKRRELYRAQVGSALNLLSASDARIQFETQLADTRGELARLRRQIEAKQREREAWERGWAAQASADLARAATKLAQVRETLRSDALRSSVTELRAERDAVVLSIARVSPGSVVTTGTELLSLVPEDAPVEIAAELPGGDEAFVQPGQAVVLKFDSLPFTVFGTAQGRVIAVSPSSYLARFDQDRAARLPSGGDPAAPYFKLRVLLGDTTGLHGLPAGFRILPGMPVTADVKVGRQSVLQYLLGHALGPVEEGFRDPT